mmetsp:Transcript_34241/g.78971  ORF Transcript_34241/g.78971 Transcript_34241/m.78971 type:complete len:295 (-) Transcript_34241:707-1591(-)
MQVLGKGLDESIGQCLRHDLGVIVVLRFVLGNQLVASKTGNRKHSHVILVSYGGNEIRLTEIRILRLLFGLLTQHAKGGQRRGGFSRLLVLKDINVLPTRTSVRGEETDNTLQGHAFLCDKLLHHGLGIIKQFLGFTAHSLIVEDLWIATVGVSSTQLPCLKEWIPVNVWHNVSHLDRVDNRNTHNLWCRGRWGSIKVNLQFLFFRLIECEKVAVLESSIKVLSNLLVFLHDILDKVFLGITEQRRHHRYRSRRIQNVNDGVFRRSEVRCNLDCRVHFRRCGSSDEQWLLESAL